jgi:hypothetical protein
MGCDIHTVIEEKVDGRWIGVAASDRMKVRPQYAQRDYDFFALIANVRGRGPNYPQNLPRDVSELSWHLYMRCPTDHHSVSHMALEDFCKLHNQLMPEISRAEYAVYDLTGIDPEEGEEHRVVFWFDN